MIQSEKNRKRGGGQHSNTGRRLDRAFSAIESFENDPLHGVAVCLTGLPADQKKRLHGLVKKLGGTYVFLKTVSIKILASSCYLHLTYFSLLFLLVD